MIIWRILKISFLFGGLMKSKYKLYYPDTGLLVSFVRSKNELIPVEVKSNNDRSKSLSTLIKNENTYQRLMSLVGVCVLSLHIIFFKQFFK